MKILKDNSGITLVELVVGVCLLAISSLMLVSGFVSAARVIDSATLLKNSSAAASTAIELQDDTREVADKDVDIEFDNSSIAVKKQADNTYKIRFVGTHGDGTAIDSSCSVTGTYVVAVDKGTGGTNLKYREFLPNDFSFSVDATNVED